MRPRRIQTALPLSPPPLPHGEVELVLDEQHLQRVVLDGIAKAVTSIDISTADFKTMLVPTPGGRQAQSIVTVLSHAAHRGAEIRLLHSGVPTGPVLHELKRSIPTGLTIRRCPRLHAKVVILDTAAMYLGSANLTGAGLGAKSPDRRNFEIGVWTRTANLIDPVLDWYNALWEGRRCTTCRRKDICPEPLEEPRL